MIAEIRSERYNPRLLPFKEVFDILKLFMADLNYRFKWKLWRYCLSIWNHKHFLYLLRDANEYIGILILKKGCSSNYVSEVAIKPQYQNQGLGTMLLKKVIEEYPTKSTTLHVRRKNNLAISIYLKLGFNIVRMLPLGMYYTRPYDRVLFLKRKKDRK